MRLISLPLPASRYLIAALVIGLGGCDAIQQKLGYESTSEKADAEGKAVGGACRQSGRAIEDCYSIYQWLPKASIYSGWRDMDAYMRENKLETVEPQLPPAPPPPQPAPAKTTTKTTTAKKTTKTPAAEESTAKAEPAATEKPAEKAAH